MANLWKGKVITISETYPVAQAAGGRPCPATVPMSCWPRHPEVLLPVALGTGKEEEAFTRSVLPTWGRGVRLLKQGDHIWRSSRHSRATLEPVTTAALQAFSTAWRQGRGRWPCLQGACHGPAPTGPAGVTSGQSLPTLVPSWATSAALSCQAGDRGGRLRGAEGPYAGVSWRTRETAAGRGQRSGGPTGRDPSEAPLSRSPPQGPLAGGLQWHLGVLGQCLPRARVQAP